MSDDLHLRLVEAAEKAIDHHHFAHLGEAKDATVAVLRVLADEYKPSDFEPAPHTGGWLDVLAERIEAQR